MLSQVSNMAKYLGMKMFFNGLLKTVEEEVNSFKSKMKKNLKEKQEQFKIKFSQKPEEEVEE